ncbi:MAG: DinB family protein [Gemmatimonadales bacterium]
MSEQPHRALATLLAELVDGAGPGECWVLNRGDAGLLRSLDRLSAAAASARPPNGGASIAAHVDHLRYGFELMNRWSRGDEDAFRTADWSASWRRLTVTEEEWRARRTALRAELEAWQGVVRKPLELGEFELTGMISSVVHLAYHLGAIRQIDRAIAGPPAQD